MLKFFLMGNKPKVNFSLDFFIQFFIKATLLLTPLFLLPYLISSTTFPKFFLFSFLSLILFFLFLLKILFARTKLFFHPFYYFLLALGLVAFLTTFFSPSPFTSFWGSYHRSDGLICFLGYLFFAFLLLFYPGFQQKISLLKTLSFGGFLVAFFALAQNWGYLIPPFSGATYRLSSTLGNPDFLGSFLVLTMPLTLGLIFYFADKDHFFNLKLFYFFSFSFSFQLAAFYLTYTRAAWLGALIASPLFAFYLYKLVCAGKIKKNALALFFLIAGVFLAVYFSATFFLARVPSQFSFGFEDETSDFMAKEKGQLLSRFVTLPDALAERLRLHQQAIKVIERRGFFGSGRDAYHFFSARYNWLSKNFSNLALWIADRPHNDFLEVAATIGSMGLFFYLAMLIYVFLSGLRAIKKSRWPDNLFLAALLTAFLGYLIQNQFSFNIIPTSLYFFSLLALMVSYHFPFKPFVLEPLLHRHKNSLLNSLVFLSLLVFFLFSVFKISFNPLVARVKALRAASQIQAGNFFQAAVLAEEAAGLMKGQTEYLLLKGEVYFQAGKQSGDEKLLDQAIYFFRQAVHANPYHPFSRLKLAVSLLQAAEATGKKSYVEDSIEAFKDFLPFATNPSEVYYNLGVGNYYLKDYALARKNFKLALKAWSEQKDAWFLLARIAEKEGDFSEALKLYQKSLKVWGEEKKRSLREGKKPFWPLEEKAKKAVSDLKNKK